MPTPPPVTPVPTPTPKVISPAIQGKIDVHPYTNVANGFLYGSASSYSHSMGLKKFRVVGTQDFSAGDKMFEVRTLPNANGAAGTLLFGSLTESFEGFPYFSLPETIEVPAYSLDFPVFVVNGGPIHPMIIPVDDAGNPMCWVSYNGEGFC